MFSLKKISLLIIAGGKSSRLGEDKRFVEVGGENLLEKILKKSSEMNFSEIFLCVEENFSALKNLAEKYHAKILVDEIKNCGPMSGIANGLQKIQTDWALAISADMPFFDFKIFETINFGEEKIIAPIANKKIQTLSAFYHKDLQNFFMSELENNHRKILTSIKKIPHKFFEVSNEKIFFNVNTLADLKLARGRAKNLSRKIPIISITAPCSNTGKTFFIEKILQNLNLKIGVVKSTHHKISEENFTKDSFRFRQAGAKKIYVGEKFFDSVKNFSDVDLILTESRTKKFFPAILIYRDEIIFDDKIVAAFSSEEILNKIDDAKKIILFLAGK